MNILSINNESYSLNTIGDEIKDFWFSVLDNTRLDDPDFFFEPFIYLETFNAPAMVLKIGDSGEITLPIDWKIAVGDQHTGNNLEIIPLSSLNDRGFEAFVYNPLTSFRMEYKKIEVDNFYNNVEWHFPKVKNGQLLTLPITDGSNPLCVFAIKEISRKFEIISLASLT